MCRFTKGIVAAIPGWFLMNSWSYYSKSIGFTELRFADWVSLTIYGNLAESGSELGFALFLHLMFISFLTVIFSYLIPFINYSSVWLKAILYAIIVGFFIYAIPTLLSFPHLTRTSLGTVVSNFTGALIWALTMAYTLLYLDKNIETTNEFIP